MNPIKDDIAKTSKQIGLRDSQVDNLWQALQEIRMNKKHKRTLQASFQSNQTLPGKTVKNFSNLWEQKSPKVKDLESGSF